MSSWGTVCKLSCSPGFESSQGLPPCRGTSLGLLPEYEYRCAPGFLRGVLALGKEKEKPLIFLFCPCPRGLGARGRELGPGEGCAGTAHYREVLPQLNHRPV